MPYYDVVNSDPTIEEMKLVVCDKKMRPPCSEEWDSIEVTIMDSFSYKGEITYQQIIFAATEASHKSNEGVLV